MKKPGINQLTEYLSTKSEQELKDEIKELFKLFPNVKEYYQVRLSPSNDPEIVEKYRKIIEKEFSIVGGKIRLNYSTMKKAISDFAKISTNPEQLADLILSCVENGVDFTNTYGDIDEKFYTNMYRMYDEALSHILKHGLEERFQERCEKIMEESLDIGWGFGESVEMLYYECFEFDSDEGE